MKWFARVFANAFVRRIAYAVAALVLAALASLFTAGDAYAVPVGCQLVGANIRCDTRSQAVTACEEERAKVTNPSYQPTACVLDGPSPGGDGWWRQYRCIRNGGNYTCEFGGAGASASTFWWREECPAGGSWNEETRSCYVCDVDGPPLGGGYVQCGTAEWDSCPLTVCSDGCGYDHPGGDMDRSGYLIDGRRWIITTGWMPRGQTCTVGDTPGLGTPPPDSDGDGTSDGFDTAPNNPGEGGGGGEDGEQQDQDGSKSCGGPGQPACDGTNEGSGQGNTSGGGGNCQTPPSSSGDAILAQIAYQTWATRCAVEGLGQGGSGTGPGIGDGATEGTLQGIKDYLDGKGQGLDEVDDPWIEGLPGEPSDWSMGLGAGACPSPISTSISFGGASAPIEFSFQPICDLAGLLRSVFMALGALLSAYIIAGVRR